MKRRPPARVPTAVAVEAAIQVRAAAGPAPVEPILELAEVIQELAEATPAAPVEVTPLVERVITACVKPAPYSTLRAIPASIQSAPPTIIAVR